MDEIAKHNKARWKALAKADALFSRPKFDLDYESAQELVNQNGKLGDVEGKKILCLASGGGQQSAAFALLGAKVTVFDISDEQLERDNAVAEYYGFEIEAVQGDMRNLSEFEQNSFDIVYHPYSLNFVPDTREVFKGVASVLTNQGIYNFSFANPFVMGIKQKSWNGLGYVLQEPYLSKAEINYADQDWVYDKNVHKPIPQVKEYRHILSDLINDLIKVGFIIKHFSDNDSMNPDPESEPTSWNHFVAFVPPWLSVLAVYRPDLKF